MEGTWSLLELEEQVDKALDRCTRLELERRKAGGKSRDAHASMKELAKELAAFCARHERWIRFLQGRIRVGAGTSRGVAKEEQLLRRVMKRGNALMQAVKKEKEQTRCALAEESELERELELAMELVDEAHLRLEAAERIQAVCGGHQSGLVRTAEGCVGWAVATSAGAVGADAAGAGSAEVAPRWSQRCRPPLWSPSSSAASHTHLQVPL